ncbi:MAG TPA: RNA 2',3'-cyclic phosphodiesterase [Marmoricola sp.]|nr:RNA 2',3'-cyclic phosphodiesterase [Marmoricola sp.]HNJ79001.1 RNA 2',3'-cyclic phosphodiesterase [Marmoricola sp.]HNN49035.1 RNA 2',3'-cyclic phosphodiesterase [Marmoricola sp.]
MRAFLALIPPPEVTADLDAFLEVRRAAAPLRWTDPEHFHVTLVFAADLPESSLTDLEIRLARFAARHPGFRTRVHGGGAFPNPATARVLWAGLDLSEAERQRMGRFSHDLRQVVTKSGIQVSGGRFRAHITIARTRPIEATNWVRLLEGYSGPPWTADRIALVQSHLGQGRLGRPRYDVLAEFDLKPG